MNKVTWHEEELARFQEEFVTWYEENARNLPWRVDTEAYRVWISEIMLQQTRVETVIDYYLRFMEKYPTLQDLATSNEEELLKIWEGLGYYSRARNLRVAANQVQEEFGGVFPELPEAIRTLKGIGPYTTGAISSIAFQLPEPAIDGNVMRVVSRLFEIGADISLAKTRKVFDAYVRQIINKKKPGEFNQAMMDLGSDICNPTNPKCAICPIHDFCKSYANQTMLHFPVKTKKLKQKKVYYIAYAAQNNAGEYLLTQRSDRGLLANMWHFPLKEVTEKEYKAFRADKIETPENERLKDFVFTKQSIGEITHIFSHLKWHILVVKGFLKENYLAEASPFYSETHAWVGDVETSTLVFPKPQLKIFEIL